MKILAFEVREDEKLYFEKYAAQYNCEITCIEDPLTFNNLKIVEGYDGISILGKSHITCDLEDSLKSLNVNFCSTRTVGFDHIDITHAHEIGFKIANTNYPPTGVAEHTVMLMLMSLRHYKQAMWRGHVNDYSLGGLQGRELNTLTVGIVGTGKIGQCVIKYLSNFGCKILAYDMHENTDVTKYAKYTDLDTIITSSDIISLHTPLLEGTYHLINDEKINRMKDNVVLINCARGELMDIDALIRGVEAKKIGALGLDVIEGEKDLYHQDKRTDIISNQKIAYLRQFPNVILTQHMAFYTDIAVESMVKCSIEAIHDFIKTGNSKTSI
ncbi:D-lactate dehydrogenase [Clostridium acetobutylicum]|uniref:D-lactate dehydrogenase n=1 Tax=Clostridium acetobutylicum (strain ATCC 824 / DSM 792 / JCM 1419 / IAM 19013 / LMG 5710 / NBRC 13948 / NRRL B-527 / VKM B-1787 / 2291 / W) TaxID=272562 RepID=Q97FN7_CLOAB|nr:MULTISPECIES: D-isomer specific 2-hydroxyacid dehydrogenase family protein [Clostridium]AAK80638.1 D-lactate dehydrogenase [Clostridium acetobutylicum ATCC 824]ADZ21737.1 D-lactate dehydrogenase [Clostridium acetobutylicum EA 2018]AEI34472.1 D-lactate dehydrogenase [Clostridium acetobutylicum DSM 1731]AWV78945.1 lactate dehydrogenase [Clostridium acetobutylicum]MBC2395184.1 lactate dehydrogenase [Clostridium acetobutylicum]